MYHAFIRSNDAFIWVCLCLFGCQILLCSGKFNAQTVSLDLIHIKKEQVYLAVLIATLCPFLHKRIIYFTIINSGAPQDIFASKQDAILKQVCINLLVKSFRCASLFFPLIGFVRSELARPGAAIIILVHNADGRFYALRKDDIVFNNGNICDRRGQSVPRNFSPGICAKHNKFSHARLLHIPLGFNLDVSR